MSKMYIMETGNVWHNPTDIITVFGSGFKDYISSIKMCRIEDLMSTENISYLPTIRYDSNFATSNIFKSSKVKLKDFKVNDCEVVQMSEDTMQIRIPANFKNGIFALIVNTVDGDEIIRYINSPKINFCLGNEGETVTPGGKLFISGSNIGPDNAPNKVKLIIKNANNCYDLECVKNKNEFSCEFTIPENAAFGEYEFCLYNGFGDNTCWSSPKKVKIFESPKSSWSTKVFNVKDFGAVGNGSLHNDTPNIILALRAAAENGGGVVLLPKGTYTLIHPIEIPDNVHLKGEGIIKSKIIWIPYNWDTYELPNSMIDLGNNVEISEIDFSGTRLGPIFVANNNRNHKNIYIHDCRIFLTPRNGGPTWAHPIGNNMDMDILKGIVANENTGYCHKNACVDFLMNNVDNLQIYNIDSMTESSVLHFAKCKNIMLLNCIFKGEGMASFNVKNCLIKNCRFDGYGSALAGDNIHHENNQHLNSITNNREIMTTDGGGSYPGPIMEYQGPTTYKMIYSYPKDSLVDSQMIIHSGVGKGQMRRITANNDDMIEIESSFIEAPNSESCCSIQFARSNLISFNNYFYNSGDFQYYGTQLNTVFANNKLEKMRGIAVVAEPIYGYNMPIMYLTVSNNLLWDANFLHHVGYDATLKPFSKIEASAKGNIPNVLLCFELLNNQLLDGYFIAINNGLGDIRLMSGITVQKNKIKDADYGFYLSINKCSSDIIFIENDFVNVANPYVVSKEYLEAIKSGQLVNAFFDDFASKNFIK